MSKEIENPNGINATDLKYPSWESIKKNEGNRIVSTLEFWYTERFGWCIPTLFISKARRGSGMNDRSYGISLGGQVVTMGKGPHVLKTITVYVRKDRQEVLQKYLDLKTKGEGDAGSIRDRISTRRSQTTLRRSTLEGWL